MGRKGHEKSKDLWGGEADDEERYGKGFHWVESPIVYQYVNQSISGNPSLDWLDYSVGKYIEARQTPRILSLGCGGGALERDLLRLKPDISLVAMDFSPGAIELARTLAAEADLQIDYRVADLN